MAATDTSYNLQVHPKGEKTTRDGVKVAGNGSCDELHRMTDDNDDDDVESLKMMMNH